IQEAHKRGIKVTGHLCSIGFKEAAALGIDDLEHGLMVDTEFDPGKTPDVCPQSAAARTPRDRCNASASCHRLSRDALYHFRKCEFLLACASQKRNAV